MGALTGIRVLDLSFFQQGPSAASMLGAMGADVIKIEHPVTGDPGRGVMYGFHLEYGIPLDQRNFYYEVHNRNKRGITLNLADPRGRTILYKLVEQSDVFLHNLRPKAASKLGVDYATLRRHNPKLVYASGSGYGPAGDDSDTPCLDQAALARSGFLAQLGEPGSDPLFLGIGVADQTGALCLTIAILMALLAVERQGLGQEVSSSLLGGMLWLQSSVIGYSLVTGSSFDRHSRRQPHNPLNNHYRCADDKWILIAGFQADRAWPALCEALGMLDVKSDPRFATAETRMAHSAELVTLLDGSFAKRDRDAWLSHMRRFSEIVCAPIQTHSEVADDPQVLQNGYVVEYDHPTYGRSRVLGYPIHASETPLQTLRPEAAFGQHTEEVLMEMCGCSWDELAALRDEGVI